MKFAKIAFVALAILAVIHLLFAVANVFAFAFGKAVIDACFGVFFGYIAVEHGKRIGWPRKVLRFF